VLLLSVSVALNGYLLKGISTGTGSTRSIQPAQVVRFNAVDQPQEKQTIPRTLIPLLFQPSQNLAQKVWQSILLHLQSSDLSPCQSFLIRLP
jgi:hypothetical protein